MVRIARHLCSSILEFALYANISEASLMTKAAKTKTEAAKKCSKRGCRNDAASTRAKFCGGCFKKHARSSNCKRKALGGNSSAKGVIGNSGNSSSKGVVGNSGNATSGKKKKLAGQSRANMLRAS